MRYLSFGSPVSSSAGSNPIFEIKSTEEKTNISTPMFSVSGKISYPLVLWMQAPCQKEEVLGLVSGWLYSLIV